MVRPEWDNRVAPFLWRDGERLIAFGRGRVKEAVELLGGPGFTLLTTERAKAVAPAVVAAAGAVHLVPPGLVDEIAGDLLGTVDGDRFVALGGGRVVDTAKALAAATDGARAMAIPTTLSGAEMTAIHRMPRGIEGRDKVRPAVVINDAAVCASQPVPEAAASALNGLGHCAEAPCTPYGNPVATLAAHRGAELLVRAFDRPEPDRDALALGALLAGYSIDSAGYGLHHVMSQTLVRVAGVGHGPANAGMLPHTLSALAWRFASQHEEFARAVSGDPSEVASRLGALAGASRLRDLGVTEELLRRCAEVAAQRAELDLTPPRADRAELQMLYEAAF